MSIGSFIAHETYLFCPYHGKIHRPDDLQQLVPFKGTYGYDVLVHVGKSLYLRSMSEKAIKKELELMAIKITENGIRYLGQKFIAYLNICHQQSQLKLRLKMAQNGGYILHIDGTCEGDSPHLFTGMDEISGIILSSIKINSEKKDKIVPFLKDIKERYGIPLAVVSDMGKGLMAAVEEVFPGVIYLICHFHFLRDIGKDLLEAVYRDLRNLLTKSKIRVALHNKAKDFEKKLGKQVKELGKINSNPELASVKTALLIIHWIFDTSLLSGYGFPFDMKHFVFYKRLVAGYEKTKQLFDLNGGKPFYQLMKLLDRIINDKDMKQAASFLEDNEKVFNELREALRITLADGKKGLNDNGENYDMKSISDRVAEFIEKYASSKHKAHKKMIKQIRKYYAKLFADPIPVMVSGSEIHIQPQRTNNIMERLFRHLKRYLRKKSGNLSVKRSIAAMMPGTLLVRNLENEEYLELMLDGADDLEQRFAQIDSHLFLNEFSKMRSHNKKISADVRKLIKEDNSLDKIEKMFLAIAS